MKPEEALVRGHLTARGFSLQFEPEGKSKPPDFLVNGGIALEVRRLNLNYALEDGSTQGLEVGRIPFRKHFDAVLASFGGARDGKTWGVFYRIKRRPIGQLKEIKVGISNWIDAYAVSPQEAGGQIDVGNWLSLTIYPYGDGQHLFSWVGGTDYPETIFPAPATRENIRLCAIEKLHKTAKIRERYDRWWLGLVNYIHFDLSPIEQQLLRTDIAELSEWHRVLVISVHNPEIWFEV